MGRLRRPAMYREGEDRNLLSESCARAATIRQRPVLLSAVAIGVFVDELFQLFQSLIMLAALGQSVNGLNMGIIIWKS
jgi:hypothetical protein